jgi:hypothetical protein
MSQRICDTETGAGAVITGGKPFANGQLWRQHVVNNGGIGDTGIFVELMEVDTKSNQTLTAIATQWLIDQVTYILHILCSYIYVTVPHKSIVLHQGATILSAPEGAFVEAAAKVAEVHQIPIVSGMSGNDAHSICGQYTLII